MFERMLVGRMENRITVGVLCFVLTMILLGWAAINEGGRMQAFTESEHARSIENGAMTYVSACSECHGVDGRGQVGIAPGLDNPQFFSHDFFPEITNQVANLEKEASTLANEVTTLNAETADANTTEARKTEITARLAEITVRTTEITSEIDALNSQRVSQVQAAADKGYDPSKFDRLANVGWGGTHESFILTTLIHGRPVSKAYWPRQMPTWSQLGGGPLRMDQLEDLVSYVMNWDKGDQWTLDDLFAVNQFAVEPGQEGTSTTIENPVGTDVQAVLTELETVTGDPVRGEELYHGKTKPAAGEGTTLPCSGCHQQTADGTGPMTNGTFTRAETIRVNDPALAGYTPEHYLVESILLPGNYIVPNFNNLMPQNFGEKLQIQDLADLIAYLETMK